MSNVDNYLATAKARKNRLFDELGRAPVVEVLGVVAPGGVGGSYTRGDDFWVMRFSFAVWRIVGGDLQTQSIDIHQEMTNDELDYFRQSICEYDVLRIRARVVIDSFTNSPQALLDCVIGVETVDAELNEQAEFLQQPVTFDDPLLGTFTLSREIDWFCAQAVWRDGLITLDLTAADEMGVQAALQTARELWSNQAEWQRRISDFAVQDLLQLKNSTWLDEGEKELTADEFVARMTLESISVSPDGSFEFWHDDGDLFWGHSIQVSGNLAEGPTQADIPG